MVGPFKATCAEGWVKMFWAGGEGQVLEVLSLTVDKRRTLATSCCGKVTHQPMWQ